MPFVMYERHLADSIIKTRRQARFLFDKKLMSPLAKHMGASVEELHRVVHRDSPLLCKTDIFMYLLPAGLPIHYGHHLNRRTLQRPDLPFKPMSEGESIVQSQKISFVVAADGACSTCMRNIYYCSTIAVLTRSCSEIHDRAAESSCLHK